MRGLIYKDTSIFFKTIDKKSILIVALCIALLIANTGRYSGLFASIMLAMTIGMQNILSFASDEKVNWKKYQLTLPVSSFAVVASKYISVMFTVAVSILGSVIFNALSSVVFQDFNSLIWGFSAATAVVIPLLWTGICLPLTYWFGFRSAQILGLLAVIPLFCFIKYFEDGPGGVTVMITSVYSYMLAAIIISVLIFGISLAISTAGYSQKRN